MNICEHLTVTAKLFPAKEALVFEQQRFTFGELDGMSQAAALVLEEAGLERGDRVAIMLPNVPAFIVWYFAALRLGAIVVSISTRLAAAEVSFVVSDCDAKLLISLDDSLATLKEQLPSSLDRLVATNDLGDICNGASIAPVSSESSNWVKTEPDEPALILYTSGTTGFAKGATLSHMNVRSNVCAFNHLCNMQPNDHILLAVPLFHCFGQNALLNSALNVGAKLVLQRSFDPHESRQLIAEENVSQLYGVPMMFQVFHDSCEPSDLASVNYCFSAAATLPIQTSHRWQEKFGMPIYEGYGLTETSPFASYNHRIKFVPGSIGTAIDGVEMKIVDTETGEDCSTGELGEIAIRGPNVMIGYWNRPDDTATAIRDGWFHSGDIGRQDENGFFYIVDRVKDMIAVGGLKVYPAEVERVLLDHPSVSQVAVVGFPDAVFGEKVIAFVVPVGSIDAPRQSAGLPSQAVEETASAESSDRLDVVQIRQYAKDNLANYKVPRRIVFIDELPRNPSGKVLKTKLREMDLDGLPEHFQAERHSESENQADAIPLDRAVRQPTLRAELERSHAASRKDIANRFVQKLVQTITGSADAPDSEIRFLDAGLDSLMIVEMSSQIQVEVGPAQEIPATLVFDYPRVCDLGEFLVQELTTQELPPTPPKTRTTSTNSFEATSKETSRLETEVASLTEAQALEELIKELEA